MTFVRTSDFDYNLPQELIAQSPIEPRDHSKLLILKKDTGIISYARFFDLPDFLEAGDCLVFNNSRVIPARLRGNLHGEPMDEIVVVLLHKEHNKTWEALVEVGEVEEEDIIDFTGFQCKVMGVGEKVGKRRERILGICKIS